MIETVLSNGLTNLEKKSFDTLIIAGMGGMLMKQILENGADKISQIDRCILSPHQDEVAVRMMVHQLGFKIIDEDFIEEEHKYYVFIICEKGLEERYSGVEYKYGKLLLKNKNQQLKAYLEKKAMTNKNILSHLEAIGKTVDDARVVELNNELAEINEVVKWLIL
jgi:tRNA (adenine22-N1)-methyltransferase